MGKEESSGTIASSGYAKGKVVLVDENNLSSLPTDLAGYILLSKTATTDITPLAFGALGIITETGGIMSHLAIVAREIGVPFIISDEDLTEILKDGDEIEILALGDVGTVGKVING